MSIPTRPVCESRSMTAQLVDTVVARSLAGAVPRSFWLDQAGAPEPAAALCDGDQALVDADIRELAAVMATMPQLMGRTLSRAADPLTVG